MFFLDPKQLDFPFNYLLQFLQSFQFGLEGRSFLETRNDVVSVGVFHIVVLFLLTDQEGIDRKYLLVVFDGVFWELKLGLVLAEEVVDMSMYVEG